MIRIFAILATALLCMQVTTADAFQWQFEAHSTNMRVLEREINGMFAQGFVPVGLTFLQGKCNILYINTGDSPRAWYLDKYPNQYALEQGVNTMTGSGYTPMGLSQYRGNFWVIYIMDDLPINNWAVITSRLSLQSLKMAIRPYVGQGLLPFGMGSTSQQFLTLLVDAPEMSATEWMIEGYALNRSAIKRGLDQNTAMGRIPWGFLHHGGEIFIVYLTP